MTYFYLKSLHIIFVVTWFAGLFYVPRLFIYNTEANEKPEPARKVLQDQFRIMMKRLWYGITWPSAIITLGLGIWVMFAGKWNTLVFDAQGRWLLIKILFVMVLYAYHFWVQVTLQKQVRGIFIHTSMQLRVWNEVATVLLVSIVMLATVKQGLSAVWGTVGLIAFIALLMSAIRIYKIYRLRREAKRPG